jgi:hypothetical protein
MTAAILGLHELNASMPIKRHNIEYLSGSDFAQGSRCTTQANGETLLVLRIVQRSGKTAYPASLPHLQCVGLGMVMRSVADVACSLLSSMCVVRVWVLNCRSVSIEKQSQKLPEIASSGLGIIKTSYLVVS